jgi:transcriptional regulator with XRE-family HTH domain
MTAAFAANLNRLMAQYGIRDAHLADEADVSRQLVGLWRNGKCFPKQKALAKTAEMLHCSIEYLTTPQPSAFAANLRNLMKKHGFDAYPLADYLGMDVNDVIEWLRARATPPGMAEVVAICDYIKMRHAVVYEPVDLLGNSVTIPLRSWARRENIPLNRAQSLFEMGLVLGAVETPFGLLIPITLHAPTDSKRLVATTKRRPRWGVFGLNNFYMAMNSRMTDRQLRNQIIADATEVSATTVQHWRTGIRLPNEENMRIIATVLGCEVEEMISERVEAA